MMDGAVSGSYPDHLSGLTDCAVAALQFSPCMRSVNRNIYLTHTTTGGDLEGRRLLEM